MKRNLFSKWKKSVIFTVSAITVGISSYANYTISTNMTLANLLAVSPAPTDTLFIAAGGSLTLNNASTFPSGITAVVVQPSSGSTPAGKLIMGSNFDLSTTNVTSLIFKDPDGCTVGGVNTGQLIYPANEILNISSSTSIVFENTCDNNNGSGNSPGTSALAGHRSNQTQIRIDGNDYSTGQGNACVSFSELIAQGGTPTINQSTSSTSTSVLSNTSCGTTFDLISTLEGGLTASTAYPINLTWSMVSGPGTATFSPSSTSITSVSGTFPNNTASTTSTITVSTIGDYIFKVSASIPLGTDALCGSSRITQEDTILIAVRQNPTATITGGGTLNHNSTPTTSATVDFTGAAGTPEYTFVYNINGGTNQTGTSTSNVYSVTQLDTDPVGTYDYALVSVSDAFCTTNYTSSLASIVIQAALPVKLTNFDVAAKNCVAEISWESAMEADFAYYQIEKSTDGISFNVLDKINGKGAHLRYSYSDKNLGEGKSYYRLKMVDKNGTFNYSNVKTITTANCNAISIESTVVRNSVTLHLSNVSGDIKIIDLNGKVVSTKTVNQSKEVVSITQLPAGSYILNVVDGKRTVFTSRIIKQ